LKAARALKLLAFDVSGNPIASTLTLEQLEQQPDLAAAAAAAASASADASALSADAAGSSATASASSATAADTAKNKAQQWAENPEDSPVEPGLFSAKHWAAKAMAALSGLTSRVTTLEGKTLTRGTAQATTSGTSIDFTGLPSVVKRLTLILNGVSSAGSSGFLVQLGAGSIENTGYASAGSFADSATSTFTSTAGFVIRALASANSYSIKISLENVSGNTWVASHSGSGNPTGQSLFGGGNKTLGGVLDRLRLTSVNGTDAFDLGSANIFWEG
jgi:hypothetical protein